MLKENELCDTCNWRTDCLVIPKGCPFKAQATIEAATQELQKRLAANQLLGTDKVLSYYGDWHPTEIRMLEDICTTIGCRLGKIGYDYDFIKQVDKKVKVAQEVFAEYGLSYRMTFNTSFHEDWSWLGIDEDLVKICGEEWTEIRDEYPDLFYNVYRDKIYAMLGIYESEKFMMAVLACFHDRRDELEALEVNSDT